jgi:hypothetical protein
MRENAVRGGMNAGAPGCDAMPIHAQERAPEVNGCEAIVMQHCRDLFSMAVPYCRQSKIFVI